MVLFLLHPPILNFLFLLLYIYISFFFSKFICFINVVKENLVETSVS